MRILWIVNTIFPYPARQIGMAENDFGGWLNGLADNLKEKDEVKLAIATLYSGKNMQKFDDGKVIYYLLPGIFNEKYDKNLEKYWQEINKDFKPDLVHMHGTEFPIGLAYLNASKNIKSIVSIQGLVSKISEVYLANIPEKEILKNITLRDIIRRDNVLQAKNKFAKRGKYEKDIIKRADVILGRTTWDYANCKAINDKMKYYISNETLRRNFYNKNWSLDNIDKYSFFISQGSYPIKGLHYAIEALSILKNKYPDVKLYVAGSNIIKTDTLKQKIKLSGYAQYLRKLIKRYKVENNIIFLGLLNEKQMVERLLKTNVFISASAIENSSNSLGEAMLLGMPCVASNVGGTMDILEHRSEGFLYPYTEPAMLAEYISEYFENEKLCIEYGKNAKKKALERHNIENNIKNIISIYRNTVN